MSSSKTTTPATTTTTSTLRIGLVHGSNDPSNAVMIKLLWAARLYQVEVTATAASAQANDFWQSSNQHPALVLLQQQDNSVLNVVGGGGNSMALALARMGQNDDNATSRLEDAKMEDWLDWERTNLRHADNNKKLSLQHLVDALEHRRKHHHHAAMHCLVGRGVSVADVCVVTTLLSSGNVADLPEIVQEYVQHHKEAFEQAKQAVQEFDTSTTSSSTTTSDDFAIDMSEPRLYHVLRSIFGRAISTITNGVVSDNMPSNLLTKCSNPKHGDYQCNAAMPTFATLKQHKNTIYKTPQEVAAAIVAVIGDNHAVVMDLTVQGPGFVMMRLRPAFLQSHVNQCLNAVRDPTSTSRVMPFPPNIAPQTCVVDFSSPNIAKEMHVGHLRSTIIGESVCRILEAVGHKVHRVNHVGDNGTQFGMLIQYLKELQQEATSSDSAAVGASISDLTQFYKKAKQRFDESPGFKKQSQLNVVKLQAGDEECVKIWTMLCDTSRAEFEKVYRRLDVTLYECGESFYNDKIPTVIEEFEKAGLLEAEEGGAKVVRVENFKVPLMLQKSDGGYGYDSTDAAALKYRLFELKADRIIIITDFTQGDHFKLVYGAGRAMGWTKDTNQRLEHIGFGTVSGEDGKKFATRSGETVRLVDLLDEAVTRMEQSLRERIAEGKSGITADEVHDVAEAIGYGAVKYYDLRRNPTSNYKFSYDQMLDTKGDTAVYLLYARVRLESIAVKAKAEFNVDIQDLLASGEQIVIEHPSERNLALNLLAFADMYEKTLDELFPCNICEYVYKLSIAVGEFATQCKVLGSPDMKSRLLLCHVSTLAMKQCFELLGIRNVMRI